MQDKHQSHRDRLDVCLVSLQNTADMRAKSALWKFYNNTRLIWVELDKEMVTCRRKGRPTPKYIELEAHFDECIRTFEQWAIMGKLMY